MQTPPSFLPTTLPTDDLLLLDLHRRVAAFIEDTRDPSMAVYLTKANGAGRCLWQGHKPPADHHDVAIKLVRALNLMIGRATCAVWVVVLAGWKDAEFCGEPGRYLQTFMVRCDGDGDKQLVLDTVDRPHEIARALDRHVFQCFDAYVEMITDIEEAGVTADMMCPRAQNLDKVYDPVIPEPPPRRPRHEPRASRAAARRPSAFQADPSRPAASAQASSPLANPAPSVSPTHGTP